MWSILTSVLWYSDLFRLVFSCTVIFSDQFFILDVVANVSAISQMRNYHTMIYSNLFLILDVLLCVLAISKIKNYYNTLIYSDLCSSFLWIIFYWLLPWSFLHMHVAFDNRKRISNQTLYLIRDGRVRLFSFFCHCLNDRLSHYLT